MSTTTSTGDAFQAGDLAGAIAAATSSVRAAPRDAGLRWLLSELLLFNGEVERADRTLDAVIEEEPSPPVLEFRRLLRAEEIRRQVFREGRVPKFQGDDPTPSQAAALRALTLTRTGDLAGAAAAAAEAESLRPKVAGEVEAGTAGAAPVAFDEIRDVDDVFAPQLEVLTTAGEYMWVPFERLRSLEFEAARRPRDLCWRRAAIELKDGQEGVVYLPAVYPWSDPATPPVLRLGRETDWTDSAEGPVRGKGQRLLLVGEEAIPLSDIAALRFA
jgi:type VI secretion system protein ImpE